MKHQYGAEGVVQTREGRKKGGGIFVIRKSSLEIDLSVSFSIKLDGNSDAPL